MNADISRAYLKLFQSLSKEAVVHANDLMVRHVNSYSFGLNCLAIFWKLYTMFFLITLILPLLGSQSGLVRMNSKETAIF